MGSDDLFEASLEVVLSGIAASLERSRPLD